MELVKATAKATLIFAAAWLALWAMSYTACVGTYHSSECRQDLTSQIVFKVIKK